MKLYLKLPETMYDKKGSTLFLSATLISFISDEVRHLSELHPKPLIGSIRNSGYGSGDYFKKKEGPEGNAQLFHVHIYCCMMCISTVVWCAYLLLYDACAWWQKRHMCILLFSLIQNSQQEVVVVVAMCYLHRRPHGPFSAPSILSIRPLEVNAILSLTCLFLLWETIPTCYEASIQIFVNACIKICIVFVLEIISPISLLFTLYLCLDVRFF